MIWSSDHWNNRTTSMNTKKRKKWKKLKSTDYPKFHAVFGNINSKYFFGPTPLLFFLMGYLMTSSLPSTGRSLDYLLPEPGLMPQSLSSEVSDGRPAHLDSTESADPLLGMAKLTPVRVVFQNTLYGVDFYFIAIHTHWSCMWFLHVHLQVLGFQFWWCYINAK